MSSSNHSFDVVIIGAGPGGYVAAIRAAQLGFSVAIVEKDKHLGGTCLLRGCIPTKALLESAAVYEQSKHAADYGVVVSDVKLDYEGVRKYKHKIVIKSAKGVEYLMNKNKVKVFKGVGFIEDPHTVSVTSGDTKERLSAKFILVATGSVPRDIPIFPTDGVRIINSDHALEMTELPASIVILGAGAVGVEFASVMARFGVETTLVEMLPRVLPIEDAAISAELERALRAQKIAVKTNTKCEAAAVNDHSVAVTLVDGNGERATLQVEKLLVAVGRRPISAGIGLENTRATVDKGGYIEVNGFLQTAEPSVYAIGDVINTPWLAHVASAEGIVAVEHMAGHATEPINYDRVPSCTYCEPEVASVGLTEAKARERGYEVKVGSFPFAASGKARILGQTEGMVKIVSDAKYDELLGVHIIGPRATELIAEACVALRGELTTEELMRTIHAHPTLSESVMEAAHGVFGSPIHI
ncbi:dihydrolipoyl dehydrogenase [Chloracidobacterium validum]|uniref:Dihydrolipoyl dehydrogenase n=1 Tax=Chloracidobacterium validum TaxID=2821543 RepID=A0ABX8BAT1_9BACT|nr:dihydrolipoyl dehydrogenase [Chloracidobacterium validum]QUW02845.1 dihydrolipoyl dehydrogenase [Chloracidobacterium validum]